MSSAAWKDLATRYNAAWNAHDVPAIMVFHAEDTSYQRHGIQSLSPILSWLCKNAFGFLAKGLREDLRDAIVDRRNMPWSGKASG